MIFFRLSGSTFNNFSGVRVTSWKAKCIFTVDKPYYRFKVASDRLKIVRAHFFKLYFGGLVLLCIASKFIPSVWDSKFAQLRLWLTRFLFQFLLP